MPLPPSVSSSTLMWYYSQHSDNSSGWLIDVPQAMAMAQCYASGINMAQCRGIRHHAMWLNASISLAMLCIKVSTLQKLKDYSNPAGGHPHFHFSMEFD